jgi:hypothetical protein
MGLGGWRHAVAVLPPGMKADAHFTGGWAKTSALLDGCGISPPPGFDPRTVQAVVRRYKDWAIPAPTTWVQRTLHCCTMHQENSGLPYYSCGRGDCTHFTWWGSKTCLRRIRLTGHVLSSAVGPRNFSNVTQDYAFQVCCCCPSFLSLCRRECKIFFWCLEFNDKKLRPLKYDR